MLVVINSSRGGNTRLSISYRVFLDLEAEIWHMGVFKIIEEEKKGEKGRGKDLVVHLFHTVVI